MKVINPLPKSYFHMMMRKNAQRLSDEIDKEILQKLLEEAKNEQRNPTK
jgi:hypothetical protein